METVIPVLTLVGLLAAWTLFLHKRSRGRAWSPLWMAFGATLAAGLFLVAGTLGYMLSRHDRFIAGTAWSGGVIWWQIWVGVATSLLAVLLWRAALRSLRTN
ncbi:MAG TPA: hypothetical protein VJ813_02420 [Vicinamibacterales bacterium]|nr:hypothetical protein [Vicinamibacterales bacterium]